jgi:outer membrane protein assembly factor BamB
MKSPICVTNRKQTPSFRIAGLLLAVVPLWLILAAANTSVHAQTPSPSDWTEFHRDNMQRWNPYETVLGVDNVGSLQLQWKYNSHYATSSPAVVNGVVYIGSFDGNVYALNAGTGAKLWSYTTGSAVYSAPAVVNGVVYFGSSDGNVYALNAGTGAKLWSYATGSGVYSSPVVVNGVVYIGSYDYKVYALSAGTGAKLWSYTTGNEVYSSPAVANGVVYVGSFDGNVYALNANTGAKLWSYSVGQVYSSPAVANGVVYIGAGENEAVPAVYALNASTGAKLWSYTTGVILLSSPAVANGVVYIGSTANSIDVYNVGYVYALNANTGAELWSYTTGGWVDSSPAVANGVVYIGADDKNLYAFNASTGKKLWSYSTVDPVDSSPTVTNGVVYVASGGINDEGQVYSFNSTTGQSADLYLRIWPSTTKVHQGDLLTFAFPVWNLGPNNAVHEVLNTQVPAGTTFDYIRISGTPGLGTCTHPPYQGTGKIVCHENSAMAPNTTWTVRVTVKVTAPAGTVITESAAALADTTDPNLANNTATVSTTVQ